MEPKEPQLRINYGVAEAQGLHHDMEDRHDVIFKEGEQDFHFYAGVFDGHGGSKISQYLRENLFSILQKNEDYKDNLELALVKAFVTADQRVSHIKHQGSAALALIIRNNELFIAHAGNCRAVVYRFNDNERQIFSTRDHRPNDEKERKRIFEEGGQIFLLKNDGYRVAGITQLVISRSIGDYLDNSFGTKPKDSGLSCLPEINKQSINSALRFIILASDGVWKVMSSKKAAFEVKRILALFSPEKAVQKAAERLVTLAQKLGSHDDITVVVIKFTELLKYS